MAIEEILSTTGTGRLSPHDRLQLCQWNQFVPQTVHQCVHQMIHERCLLQAEAIAVSAWDGSWSYRQLDEMSTRIARVLIDQHGVQPETFIPICAQKSRWMPVAMLAVIKAGGAFVLIDPSHPPQRLRQISEQVASSQVLVSASCVSLAPSMASKWLVIEEALALPAEKDHHLPKVAISPSNAMYAVFTSGSTGTPKGAVMTHAGYASSATHMQALLRLGPQSRVLQFASYAFDVSISDHLLTFLAGGCVCIPSPTERDLATAITEMQMNWACLTPSVARTIRPGRVPGLQHLVMAGEAVTQTDVDLWAPFPTTLINMYGPAEHAIGITTQGPIDATTNPASIGNAPAAVCWVVDPQDHHELIPVGEEGELVVEGPALSRGYINDQFTAAAFIDAPKWLSRGREAVRMYKTGDLVCYTPDGSLEYRGRKDTLVKLRGQRVELGEVEHHVLKCCPAAQAAVAEVVASTSPTAQLVVFLYAPDMDGEGLESGTDQQLLYSRSAVFQEHVHGIQSALRQRVPSYMVPTTILRISHIPLTKTGKSDRRLLQEHAHQFLRQEREMERAASKQAPVTTKEKALQGLWAEVLDVSPVSIGRHDNWLSLGGDSLLAMMLVGRARESGLVLTVQDVFHHPRLIDLAATASEDHHGPQEVQTPFSLLPEAPDLRQAIMQAGVQQDGQEIEDIYPCLGFQAWFCRMSIAKANNWTAEVEVFLPSGLSEERLARAWTAVVQAHPMLRTHIVWLDDSGPFWQVVLKEGPPMEIVSADSGPPRKQNLWGLNQPLTRLFKQQDTLRLLMHHVGWDMHAISVIFQQLGRAYDGQALPLRPMSPLVLWARRPGDAGEKFWRHCLTGLQAPKFPALPAEDYVPRTTAVSENYAVRLRKGSGAFTVDSRLRLALAIVISRAIDSPNVVFGAAVARRAAPLPGVMDMVAPLTIMQPVPVRLDAKHTLQEALQVVQDHSLEAASFPKADLTFFRGLGPEVAAACDYHTLIELQPSPSMLAPGIFAEQTLHDHGICNFGLLLECDYRAECTNVVAKYDEQVLSASQVTRLLEQFVYVAELTESALDTSLDCIVLP